MNLSDRSLRLTLALGVAVVVAVISLTEGSLLAGVLITGGLLAVFAALLLAGSFLARSIGGDTSRPGEPGVSEEDEDGGGMRGAVRLLTARPWRSGTGVLTVANSVMTSRAGTLMSPRGRQLAAPQLCLEFNPRDLAAVTARWPADILAAEYAAAYVEHTRRTGMKRVVDHTTLSILESAQVPIGRVVVTPAFALAAGVEPVAQARVVNTCPPANDGATRTPEHAAPANPTIRTAQPAAGNPTIRPPGTPTAGLPFATLTPLDAGSAAIELRRTTVTLGRGAGVDGTIEHPSVSRRHVLLSRGEEGWAVRDPGSTNGVFVNGSRVTGTVVAVCGDVVRLGAGGPRFRLDVHPDVHPRKEVSAA